ncbi:MAG: DUF3305 domain-containing protein [Pseudomonadota bacterium]
MSDNKAASEAVGSGSAAMGRHEKLPVGVIVERRQSTGPWQDHGWRPVAVTAGAPAAEPWSVMREEAGATQFFAGVAELVLNVRETPNYRDNLAMPEPSVYVVLRFKDGAGPYGIAVEHVTVSPTEAEAYLVAGDDIVERVPMPEVIAAWLADYIAAYHVEEPFYKRQRQKLDPRKLGFGAKGPQGGDGQR